MLEMPARKAMYYKLHNLEEFPEVLRHARDQLTAFFAEMLDTVFKERPDESILRPRTYSREGLTIFMRDCDDKVNQQWEGYVPRKNKGGPLELFKDKDEARRWLTQIALVKYVDGAWLGCINKITLPFALRPVVKNSMANTVRGARRRRPQQELCLSLQRTYGKRPDRLTSC